MPLFKKPWVDNGRHRHSGKICFPSSNCHQHYGGLLMGSSGCRRVDRSLHRLGTGKFSRVLPYCGESGGLRQSKPSSAVRQPAAD